MSAILGENFINGAYNNFLLLLPMIIIFITGNVLRSVRFLKPEDIASMTKILYWVVSPALLFRAAFSIGDEIHGLATLFLALLTCGTLAALIALALNCMKSGGRSRLRLAVSAAAATKPNAIYMGLPTALLIFGDESLVYASAFAAIAMPLHNILSPVFGELVAARGKSTADLIKKSTLAVMQNPLVSSSLLGLLFAFIGVREIPTSLDKAMQILGACAVGLSLLVLGASVETSEIFSSLATCWRDVLVRLVIHPSLLLFWFYYFPAGKELVRVFVMMVAMPTAATMFILAKGMSLDSDYAAQLTVSTTILSILTIPVWSVILSM